MDSTPKQQQDVVPPEESARLAERFEEIFQRPPTESELHRFWLGRSGLVLRIPRQARRRAASSIASLARGRTVPGARTPR